MGILAKGSKIPWESKQAAKDEYIRFLDNDVIEMRLVRGQMYKDEVQRTELRVQDLYTPGEALNLKESFKYTLLTDVNFKGDMVIAQLPWDGDSPDNSIRIDTKTKRMYYLNYNQGGNPKRNEVTLVPTVQIGQEYEIVYRLQGRTDSTGFVEVYLDAAKKVDLKGQNIFPPTDSDRYPKLGPYMGDKDLPSGLNEIVMQYRDVTFGTTDATFQELSSGPAPQPEPVPTPEPDPETNDPDPETNDPDPETNDPDSGFSNIKSELEEMESDLARMSDSITRMRETIRDIYEKI